MDEITCPKCSGCGTVNIAHGTVDCPACKGKGYLILPEPKQVIVMRKDLGMSRGKLVSQGSHAAFACISNNYLEIDTDVYGNVAQEIKPIPLDVARWMQGTFTKIVVAVNSEEELLALHAELEKTDIPIALIKDCGRTELGKPEYTCLGVGPWNSHIINKYTEH